MSMQGQTKRGRRMAGVFTAAALGFVLVGCGSGSSATGTGAGAPAGSDTAASELPTFQINAEMPYKFTLPKSTAPSGYVQVKLVNRDKEMPHQAQLVKLRKGVTFKQYKTDLTGPDGEAASMKDGTPAGGPNAIGPGQTASTTVNLTTGATYAVVCNIPGPDGKAHYLHGMVTSFKVSPDPGVTKAPDAASTIKLIDFSYEVPQNVDWSKPIAVTNMGKQPHELAILGPVDGKTLADVKAALMAPPGSAPAGPPPYRLYGGVGAIAPGETQVFQPSLPRGTYDLVCFIADAAPPHLPHFMKGMITEIDVS